MQAKLPSTVVMSVMKSFKKSTLRNVRTSSFVSAMRRRKVRKQPNTTHGGEALKKAQCKTKTVSITTITVHHQHEPDCPTSLLSIKCMRTAQPCLKTNFITSITMNHHQVHPPSPTSSAMRRREATRSPS